MNNLFSRFNTKQRLSIAFITLSYVTLLAIFYNLGYYFGSSFSIKDITSSVSSKTTSPYQHIILRSYEPLSKKAATLCGKPVPAEFIRQTINDRVYNGTSPYKNFIPTRVTSPPLLPKRFNGKGRYRVIYKSLIQKVRPKTIIKFGTSLGVSATYMANLTSQLGLKTQIICLDEFHNIAMSNGNMELLEQFIQNVISQNATESILPVNLSIDSASVNLCGWGIYGDLIEVAAGQDFHSAWSDIGMAYKLLRPGGVLFGHSHFSSDLSYYDKGVRQAVRLFARVNKFRFEEDEHHWIINSA
ncbi:Rhamnosyl O-methyltransferase [Bienertia sinuspersici]